MTSNSLVVSGHGLRKRQLVAWFSENVCEVARCLKLETPGSYRVELFLENETEVALHRFNQCFPQSHARLASPDDQLQKRPKQQTPGEEAEPHSPEATKPLRHLEQQLQELEDLLRQPGAREAAAEAAAHAVAPAAPPAELPAETETEESSDDEAAEGLLKLTLGRGTLDVSLHLRAAAGGGTGARLWTGGVLLAEWLLQAEQAHATERSGGLAQIQIIGPEHLFSSGARPSECPRHAFRACVPTRRSC
ncbi:unnamed protein product [Durusdinium trenchii]|uniref:Uncharacterized protein n=1 Tax=Durusdinium trenchii TaxID=1381693 RepID=A0ABP0N3L4_9DINO